MERIAILAGGGTLPLILADCIVASGGRAHIVGVRGEAGPAIERYPHTWVTWGAVSAIITTLKRESNGAMMIAGHVSRPDLRRLDPDFGIIWYLPQVLQMLKGGDDAVLTRLVRFFEAQGLTVKGVGDVAPHLLASTGGLPNQTPAAPDVAADTRLGFEVLDALADLDVGQAIAVEGGRVLAIEGVEGTDRMLIRIAALAGRSQGPGVLVKGPKRGQDLRVDMPTVGAATIDRLAEARLGALVVVAGKTLMLERAEMTARAAAADIMITAVARDATAVDDATRPGAVSFGIVQLGRFAPSTVDRRDAMTAATVIQRLAAFATGSAAAVVRDHVLAIAAIEGAEAMAYRVAQLRQWGHGRGRIRRRRGAAAVALSAAGTDGDGMATMIETFAGAGLAGIALVAPGRAYGRRVDAAQVPPAWIAAADRRGLFLVMLGTEP